MVDHGSKFHDDAFLMADNPASVTTGTKIVKSRSLSYADDSSC